MSDLTINKEKILQALSTVEEPDLKRDIVTLGMVRDVETAVDQVSFTVVLTTPACPLKELIRKRCVDAIHHHFGSHITVQINLTADVTTARSTSPVVPNVKNIIAISSGKGGVGKSTVTANLAVALYRSGAKVGILDADIYGPSMPVMFGVEEMQPRIVVRGDRKMMSPIYQWGIKVISMGFLTPPDQAIVWRGPMASTALKQLINDVAWDELDYLLIDMPPGTGDIHLTLAQAVPLTGVVIVTTPQKVAIADATKGLAMFRQDSLKVPILGVVENMAYFTPAELPNNKYYLFGKDGGETLAKKYDVPFLGQIPLVQSIREGGDEGRPAFLDQDNMTTDAFRLVAEALAQQVAICNAQKAI
jgi:ATP-binding protein involved in chromosome partitioning